MHLDGDIEGVDAEYGGGLSGGEHGASVAPMVAKSFTVSLLRGALQRTVFHALTEY